MSRAAAGTTGTAFPFGAALSLVGALADKVGDKGKEIDRSLLGIDVFDKVTFGFFALSGDRLIKKKSSIRREKVPD